ncbi:hypothetical protein [Actinoplanes sp. NPDC026619]|uniref:hypothetical protein n=1 Tax=Actinoplanes sp. NPDC026619 TaxID=3155798 RepID=UPI0034052486
MLLHPDLMLAMANNRHRELVAEAQRGHLLNSAREARRTRKAPAVRGKPAGNLASCDPSAAVPVR